MGPRHEPDRQQQEEVTVMDSESADLRVGNLMTVDPIVIGPEAPVSEAERLLKTYRVSGLPVVEGGEVIGVISQSDLVVARSSELIGGHWERLRVRHLMSAPAITVHTTATLRYAARQMVSRHIHRLVVVGDDGHPIGVLTPLDLLRSLVDEDVTVPLS
jgi:CBS domain-containing protein